MEHEEIERFYSEDGERRAFIYRDSNGFYRFGEEVWMVEDNRDVGLGVYEYWEPEIGSGLYGALEDARREIRAVIPWLRPQSSDE